MKKILISAFSISPNKGSEPGVGWIWATEISKYSKVFILTREKLKVTLESAKNNKELDNINFIYVKSSKFLRSINIYFEYIHWQFMAYLHILKTHKTYNFDYIWHLTFGNIFLPTLLYKIKIPFVWGPLGGGERVKFRNYKNFNFIDQVPHLLKSILVKLVFMNPFVKFPERKASLIIVKTKDTLNLLSRKSRHKSVTQLETFFKLSTQSQNDIPKNNSIFHFCYTGRLIAFKNIPIALKALKISNIGDDFLFHIIGDGPKRKSLEKLVENIGLRNKVIFHGNLSRKETLTILKDSDLYLFPSLREGGTWSLMEAMALGKPSICLKTNGMEIISNESCSIMIPLQTQTKMINEFSKAISKLYYDKELRCELGNNAKLRIENTFSPLNFELFIKNLVENL
jgi:glycosyltransferase involved in cell wall biosynthesis